MWPFNKNSTILKEGIMQGFTDWHCHILPGVDDGVQSMAETLDILSRYEDLGVETVWLTPHIMEDIPNTPARLRERFDELKAAYDGPVDLHLAAENMIDNLFEERLDKNELLTIGESGTHLLVETSYFNPPMDLYGTLERIKSKGYFPVLAHPERYAYMTFKDYDRLRDMDVRLQLNMFSLTGDYGKSAYEKACKLLEKGYYCICATDLHRIVRLEGCIKRPIKADYLELVYELKDRKIW